MNRPRVLFWDLTLVCGVLQPKLGLWFRCIVFKMIYDVLNVSSILFLSSTRHVELLWDMWLLVKPATKILTSCFKVLIDLIDKWENHTKGNTLHFRVSEAYSIFIIPLISWIRSHALVDWSILPSYSFLVRSWKLLGMGSSLISKKNGVE